MDKTVFKASGIIALIIGIFWCITLFGIIWGVPLIVGGSLFISYSNLSDEEIKEKKGAILTWSIIFILFALLPGILGLIGYCNLDKPPVKKEENKETKEASMEDQLRELDKLLKEKLITKAEYDKKKKKILDI